MKALPIHPLAELLPPMAAEEKAILKADIAANGQMVDIVLYEGRILDGRNRAEAIAELAKAGHAIEPRTTVFKGTHDEAVARVYSGAMHRSLTMGQKIWAATNFHPYYEAQSKARKSANGGDKKSEVAKSATSDPKQETAKGKSRDFTGEKFGIPPRYVSDGLRLKREAPKEFARLGGGEITLAKAMRAVQHRAKRAALEEKAKASPTTGSAEIVAADCVPYMQAMPRGKVRLVFADPMYNIDYDYGQGKKRDSMTPKEYLAFTRAWIEEARGILTPDGSLWVMICDEWAAEYGCILKDAGFTIRRWIKWYETFGANCRDNFNRCTRHLFYCVKDAGQFVFNHAAFNCQSERQRIGDKRAAAGGKLWDDTWQIARLVDNAKERVVKGATQLPLALVKPIVEGCSEVGDTVFDPFTGTGTTAVAAATTGRKFIGTEIDNGFARTARLRVRAELASCLQKPGDCHAGKLGGRP